MSTEIKRLSYKDKEFVPITLAEAVVVNTTKLPGISQLEITTLDQVLKVSLGIMGTNATNISTLQQVVNNINSALEKKQDKLTAGTGIVISDSGVISVTNSTPVLGSIAYKIVTNLPLPSKDCLDSIYLVPNPDGETGNAFTEYICIQSNDTYVWEELGKLQTTIDLSDYVTKSDLSNALINTVTAVDVTTSSGVSVSIDYDIPSDLYDSLV